MSGLNANPTLFGVANQRRTAADVQREADPTLRDPIDHLEVFDMLRSIKDPEHPHTLEQLRVVQPGLIDVDDGRGRVHIHFTPTIPHCSMATLIGLCIRVQLLRARSWNVRVAVEEGEEDPVLRATEQFDRELLEDGVARDRWDDKRAAPRHPKL